jgi:hypothetical protein
MQHLAAFPFSFGDPTLLASQQKRPLFRAAFRLFDAR